MAIIELRDLRKTYRMGDTEVHALDGVSLEIEKGDFWAIMGPSGSGKSTLLNLLGCLDRPTDGDYFLDGRNVAKMNDRELSTVRGETLGFIFQSFNLIQQLDVLENIEVPLFYQYVSPKVARSKAMSLADRVGLEGRHHHRPRELSGGQQQRVAVARALVNDPVMILADEPTGNLDSRTGDEIISLLKELNGQGTTIVMVTHEDDIAAHAKKTIHVRDGKIVETQINRSAEVGA